MRIAIASEKDKEDSLVSQVSGRAPFYLIFNDGKLVKTIKNPFAIGGGGAGLGVVQMLHNEGVKLVISGKFGEKMIGAMEQKGMQHQIISQMTVKKTVEGLSK